MKLTQDSHFQRKMSCLRWDLTHDILHCRQMLYQLNYRGSSAGWPKSHIQSNTTQGKASQPEEQDDYQLTLS